MAKNRRNNKEISLVRFLRHNKNRNIIIEFKFTLDGETNHTRVLYPGKWEIVKLSDGRLAIKGHKFGFILEVVNNAYVSFK